MPAPQPRGQTCGTPVPVPPTRGEARGPACDVFENKPAGATREDPIMPVMPGAEAFAHDGGRTGVLLCHGFTGSPQSLRPWAEYIAAAGLSVSLPLLPGPGTTWQEMARARVEDW